jgi:hypothetical protein
MAEDIVIRSELLNFDSFIKQVQTDIAAAINADTEGLYQQLLNLMEVIKSDYVPIDMGDLAASGYVSRPMIGPVETEIALGFTEPYALIQHERLDYHHTHGQAKYLEVPLEQFYESTK